MKFLTVTFSQYNKYRLLLSFEATSTNRADQDQMASLELSDVCPQCFASLLTLTNKHLFSDVVTFKD